MCRFASFTVVRRRDKVKVFGDLSNSHEKQIELAKVKDDKLVDRDIVRVEVLPEESLYSRVEEDWSYCVDEQGTLPEWYQSQEKWIKAQVYKKLWAEIVDVIVATNKYEGVMNFSGCGLLSTEGLASIGGDADFRNSQLKELPVLAFIGGDEERAKRLKEEFGIC